MRGCHFKNNGIKIRRKGGYETVVYFGDEVAEAHRCPFQTTPEGMVVPAVPVVQEEGMVEVPMVLTAQVVPVAEGNFPKF